MSPSFAPLANVLRNSPANLVKKLWEALLRGILAGAAMCRLSRMMLMHCTRHTFKIQDRYSRYLRMPPPLETLAEVIRQYPRSSKIRLACFGCGGAELYSGLYVIRTVRPDLRIACRGIDISHPGDSQGKKGVYRIDVPVSGAGLYLPGRSELLDCDVASVEGSLERQFATSVCVRDWLRENIEWLAADAMDVDLLHQIGTQDIVMADNFMAAMDHNIAESCLYNLARLVVPGGILVVEGANLEVKARVLASLHFVPVVHYMGGTWRSDVKKMASLDEMEKEAARSQPMLWRYWDATIFRSPEEFDGVRTEPASSLPFASLDRHPFGQPRRPALRRAWALHSYLSHSAYSSLARSSETVRQTTALKSANAARRQGARQ